MNFPQQSELEIEEIKNQEIEYVNQNCWKCKIITKQLIVGKGDYRTICTCGTSNKLDLIQMKGGVS